MDSSEKHAMLAPRCRTETKTATQHIKLTRWATQIGYNSFQWGNVKDVAYICIAGYNMNFCTFV